jgi:multiple sugar transport system permease protein
MFPFMVMVFGSVNKSSVLKVTLTSWIPGEISFANYKGVFAMGSYMARWLLNSAIISVIPTVTGVLICSLVGYIFAKKNFPGKNLVFWYFMAAIMIPFQALMVSNYIVYNYYRWIDTYTVFLIPGMWSVMYMFMMRQFIRTIPDALLESAKIDGSGEWTIYWHIILPLSGPALSSIAIFSFMDKWNDFLVPLIFTSSEDMYNLMVGLATMIQNSPYFNMQMTSGFISFVPMFFIFLLLQKYFIDGIVMSGIKE